MSENAVDNNPNLMKEICNLGVVYDRSYLGKLKGITDDEQKIGNDLDTILHALDVIYTKIKDPTQRGDVDLTELDRFQDEIEEIFERVRGNQDHSPFANTDLATISREKLETQVITRLESMKRNRQNAIPQLMTKMQEVTRLAVAIYDMLRNIQELDNRSRQNILHRMVR